MVLAGCSVHGALLAPISSLYSPWCSQHSCSRLTHSIAIDLRWARPVGCLRSTRGPKIHDAPARYACDNRYFVDAWSRYDQAMVIADNGLRCCGCDPGRRFLVHAFVVGTRCCGITKFVHQLLRLPTCRVSTTFKTWVKGEEVPTLRRGPSRLSGNRCEICSEVFRQLVRCIEQAKPGRGARVPGLANPNPPMCERRHLD